MFGRRWGRGAQGHRYDSWIFWIFFCQIHGRPFGLENSSNMIKYAFLGVTKPRFGQIFCSKSPQKVQRQCSKATPMPVPPPTPPPHRLNIDTYITNRLVNRKSIKANVTHWAIMSHHFFVGKQHKKLVSSEIRLDSLQSKSKQIVFSDLNDQNPRY